MPRLLNGGERNSGSGRDRAAQIYSKDSRVRWVPKKIQGIRALGQSLRLPLDFRLSLGVGGGNVGLRGELLLLLIPAGDH